MIKYKLSVIIISFNTKKILDECLERVITSKEYFENKGLGKIEVIVFDNGSKDGSVRLIKTKYPSVSLIESKKNLGFAKANNIAMRRSKGEYLLLLNSDSFIYKNTLTESIQYIKANNNIDILTIRSVNKDGSFQPCGGFSPTPIRTIAWLMGLNTFRITHFIFKPVHLEKEQYYRESVEMDWVGASFLLLKREVFEKTGGFDENIFMYTEDIEWCERIKKKNYNLVFTPDLKYVHLGGASDNLNSNDKLLEQMKGILYFHNKFYPKSLFLARSLMKVGLLIRFVFYKITGQEKTAKIYRFAYSNIFKL